MAACFWVPTLVELFALVVPGNARPALGVGNNTISVLNVKGSRAAYVALQSSNALNYNHISIMKMRWKSGK